MIEQITRLFWEQGYEATSTADVEVCSGLSRSSLYNEWGTKDQLFVAALDCYQEQLWTGMLGPLADGDAGLADVHAFLDRLLGGFEPGAVRGCLMARSIAEIGRRDEIVAAATDEYRRRLGSAIAAALRRAVAGGEIGADELEERAEALATWTIGFGVTARTLPDVEAARQQVAAAHALVDGWRR